MRFLSLKQLFRMATALLKVTRLSYLFSTEHGIYKNHSAEVDRQEVDRHTDRQVVDKQTYRQVVDRQTDRQTDKQTGQPTW